MNSVDFQASMDCILKLAGCLRGFNGRGIKQVRCGLEQAKDESGIILG